MTNPELNVAIEAVKRAAVLCQRVQASLVTDETLAKKDRSPVTVADFGSQAVINHALISAFPEIPIVAEEDASALRDAENRDLLGTVVQQVQAQVPELNAAAILEAIDYGNYAGGATGRFWTLDPIDGTKGFIRGDQYAIALALIENGEVVLGVMGCPNLPLRSISEPRDGGCLFVAAKGCGTRMIALGGAHGECDAHVASAAAVSDAAFCEPYETGHTRHDTSAEIARLLGVIAEPVRLDSQCKYAVVARGEAGVYLRLPTRADYQEKIWDHAAGMLAVTEAGGRVTDINGAPLNFSLGSTLRANKGILATSGTIHDAVLAAVKEVWAKQD